MKPSSVTVRQAHDAFIEFEEAWQLWDRTIAGVSYWHPMRFDVFGILLQYLGLHGERHGSWKARPLRDWVTPRPSHWMPALDRLRWNNINPVDLLVLNHPRHIFFDGAWQCNYTEPLLDGLPHSRVVVEQGFQGLHYHPNQTRGLKYVEAAMALGNLRVYLRHGFGCGLNRNERVELREICAALGQAFGVEVPVRPIVELAKRTVRRELGVGHYYGRLLDRARPKVVLNVIHYSHRVFPFTSAARMRGIPTVEIQHGLIGPEHLAYNLAPGRRPTTLPDTLLLFGEFWRSLTPGLPFSQTRAIGYAHLDRSLRRARERSAPAGQRRVLFLSQPSIGVQLSQWATTLAQELPTSEFELIYKLHPSERLSWKQNYPELAASRVRVVEYGDLYDALAQADVQIGVYSTALFEGFAAGLETLVAALPGHEAVLGLVNAGAARRADDIGHLRDLLRSPLAPQRQLAEAIFKPGAVENFARFIEELVNGERTQN